MCGLIRALIRRGYTLLNLPGDYSVIRNQGGLALELSRISGDRGGESLSLGLLDILSRMEGKNAEALELAGRELAIAREAGDPDVLAWALYNMARLDSMDPVNGRQTEEARYREVLRLRDQVTDELVLVRALTLLSQLLYYRGEYVPARALADESLELAEALGDPVGACNDSTQIGDIYGENQDHEMALQWFQRAEAIARTNHLRTLPVVLIKQADSFNVLGQGAKRDALIEEAMAIAVALDDKVIQAKIESVYAELLLRRGQFEEAECRMRRAWDVFRMGEAIYLFPYIEAHLAHGNYASALRIAYEQLANFEAPSWEVLALTLAGQAHKALGNREQALASFLDAAAIASAEYSATAGEEERKIGWFKDGATAYRNAADLLLHDGRVEEAFHDADSAKGGLLASLIQRRDDSSGELSPEERLEEARLRKRMTNLNVRAADAVAIRDARADYDSFRDGIQARHRRVRSSNEFSETPPLTAIASTLGRDTAIVEYLVMDDHADVFVVRPGAAVVTRTIRITKNDLSRRVADLRARISRRDFAFADRARELYELLVAPIRSEVASQQTLCIIPDDVLWDVPFAALMNRGGHYLVEEFAVVYAASAGVRVTTATAPRPSAGNRRFEIGVFANPTLIAGDRERIKAYYRDADVGDLPDAEREAKELSSVFPAAERRLYLERTATEERLKREANRFRVLHFAAHAIADDTTPMYSRILLARTPEDGEDGFLEAQEISALPIDADLVVLSACDTARGEIAPGAGMVGLSWAFFVAGARSTMATQWRVSSPATADLMIGFYRIFGDGRAAATALRTAQRQLIRGTRYRHPFYWAAFVLFD